MIQTFSPQQVLCRSALASDHKDVTEFCKDIWDGDDYVPQVWNRWLNDPNGLLAVAEFNGKAIGCSKISLMSRGQWWLEGFRVDPKYQGLKVGSRIHRYATDWWQEHGDGTIRLMTSSENLVVHHLCYKTGYVKTHELCGYRATPLAEPTDNFSSATDTSAAAAFAIESESIKATDGLLDFGWRIGMPDAQIFEIFSSGKAHFAHKFYWWKEKQGLCSFREENEDDRRTLIIGVLACTLQDLPALLTDIRRFAAQRQFDSIFQIAFDVPQIASRLEVSGFEKRWLSSSAFLFEKKHPGKMA